MSTIEIIGVAVMLALGIGSATLLDSGENSAEPYWASTLMIMLAIIIGIVLIFYAKLQP